jgi:hypothetical protein
MNLNKTISDLWNRLSGKSLNQSPSQKIYRQDPWQKLKPENTKRKKVYKEYDELLLNQYAETACTAHADHIVHGDVKEGIEEEIFSVEVLEAKNIKTCEQIIADVRGITGINNNIWDITFDLCGLGDHIREIVIQRVGNINQVVSLEKLPAGEVERNTINNRIVNPDSAYIQRNEHGQAVSEFGIWQIAHFNASNRSLNPYKFDADYGFRKSLLWTAREAHLNWQLSNFGLVMTRLKGGRQRTVHYIDTSGIDQSESESFVENKQKKYEQELYTDETSGDIDAVSFLRRNMLEDHWLPVSEDYPNNKLELLRSDSALGQIEDVVYFRNEFITSLKTPPQFFQLLEDVHTKAVSQNVNSMFARNVMRYSSCLIPPLTHIFRIACIAAGLSVDGLILDIKFPSIKTYDELIKWQVEKIKSEIIRIFGIEVGLDLSWLFQNILGMTEGDADNLVKKSYGEFKARPRQEENRNEVVERLLKNPDVSDALDSIGTLYKEKKRYE